jgi:uncharacterized membrane protein HdeD (DUF308 family)
MSTANITKENWWALVSGGVATLIFGAAAVFWPGLTLLVLLYLFAVFVLVSGVVDVVAGIGSMNQADSWFLPVALGAFELGVGIYLLRHTGVKFATFIILIGFTLIVRGIIEGIGAYYSVRASAKTQAISLLSALGAIVAGAVILFAARQSSGVSFVWILGLYGILVGALQISSLSEKVK